MGHLLLLILSGLLIVDVCVAAWLLEQRHRPTDPGPDPSTVRLLRELERYH
jgi:hypothetical protein